MAVTRTGRLARNMKLARGVLKDQRRSTCFSVMDLDFKICLSRFVLVPMRKF